MIVVSGHKYRFFLYSWLLDPHLHAINMKPHQIQSHPCDLCSLYNQLFSCIMVIITLRRARASNQNVSNSFVAFFLVDFSENLFLIVVACQLRKLPLKTCYFVLHSINNGSFVHFLLGETGSDVMGINHLTCSSLQLQ